MFLVVLLALVFVGLVIYGVVAITSSSSKTGQGVSLPTRKEAIKGKIGEIRVHNILSRLPADYTVLDDVVLRTASGTTQIDHVVVSKYGVFAIETKNYRGEIYGDDYRHEWTQIIVTDVRYMKKWWKTYSYVTKNHFYNPVKQSVAHAKAIRKALKEWPDLEVVPIVVFAGSAVLNNVTSQHHVVYDDHLLATILSYNWPCVADAEVSRIVGCLTWMDVRDQVDDRTHVNNVYAAKQNYNSKVALGICPRCGGSLVRRSGRYRSFYGCSNYPRCTFTTH